MELEISLANIEKLKNFIMPIHCPCIFFDFTSGTEFTVQFYDDVSDNFMSSLVRKSSIANLPHARILTENSKEILVYFDENYHLYEFDLTLNKLLTNCEVKIKNVDIEQVKKEFHELFSMLKKIS